MHRRLGLVVSLLAALAAAPAAHADGLVPSATQLGPGVVRPDGSIRYVALPAGEDTTLAAIGTVDGTVRRTLLQAGQWGIPQVTYGGAGGGGLSRDGRTLVLESMARGGPTTSFLIVDARRLGVRGEFALNGSFAYDALSPDGRMLYLIRYASANDYTRYVVRAYDTLRHRLLPGRIADRTQKTWVMQGWPVTRTASADGRWVYTLYQNPGGYPFVHALDTVRGVAHCIGLPWTGNDQSALFGVALDLRDGGRTLALRWRSGRPWLSVATADWRVAYPGGALPWRWVGPALAGALGLLAGGALLLRRRVGEKIRTARPYRSRTPVTSTAGTARR